MTDQAQPCPKVCLIFRNFAHTPGLLPVESSRVLMDRRAGKIVMPGTVFTVLSFLIGVFHDSLPALTQLSFETIVTAVVAGCIVISALISFALNTIVHSIIFLFMSPVGVLSMLAMLWLALSRKPQLSH